MPIGGSGTTISLSTLRGEFGGATPDSLSEYYANKAYSARGVMAGQRGYPNGVETAIPGSGQISFSNFHASRLLTPAVPGFNGQTYSAVNSQAAYTNPPTGVSGFQTVIGIVIDTPGSTSINIEDGSPSYITTNTWLTALELPAIGSSFWVRFTRTASTGSGHIHGSDPSTGWLQLTTFRARFVQAWAADNVFNIAEHQATYAIDIAADSGGTNIVSSSTITLFAQSRIDNAFL